MKKRPANERPQTPLDLAWWCIEHRILGATLCDPVAYEVLYPVCLTLDVWPWCLESPAMRRRFGPPNLLVAAWQTEARMGADFARMLGDLVSAGTV